jgi:hypothetical protein
LGALNCKEKVSVTTYVLGAGASHHAGYPLANQLGDSLVNWLAENPGPINELYGANLSALHKLYGNLRNLEQILAELEDCPPGSLASTVDDIARRSAIRNLRIMIPEFFRSLRARPSPLYMQLAQQHIRPGDVVITFNYDLACERELKHAGLWEIGDGYGFSLGMNAIPRSQVTVLKLHGSANWLEVVFQGMKGFFQGPPTAFGDRPVIFPGEFAFLGYASDSRDPLTPGDRPGAIPAIIVPTLKKRFYDQTSSGRELESFWNHLWVSAEHALWSSERIVMVGYSMSAADEKARSLLLQKSNRAARIEIFCGRSTTSIASDFDAHGFRDVSAVEGHHFEDFLDCRFAAGASA